MKIRLFKDLRIWILPGDEGRVRKFRLSIGRLACVAAALGAFVGGVFFVAGDYARLQLSKAKNELWLHMVQNERDRLLRENEQLSNEIALLKSTHGDVVAYERTVKEKLNVLSELLRSTTSLGIDKRLAKKAGKHEQAKAQPREPAKAPGIGGPEFDCSNASNPDCTIAFKPIDLRTRNIEKPELTLAGLLDQYIELLGTIPFGVPSAGIKSSGFGLRVSPFHSGIKMHEGLDYAIKTGSPIAVAADGVVADVQANGTYGHYVDVRHSDRIVTRYAHMSRTNAKVGQRVVRGQTIGYVGSTGRSTGPHLHYEVRVDGKARNPEAFLALADKIEKLF